MSNEATSAEGSWEVAAPHGGYSLVVVKGDFKPGFVVRNDDAERLRDYLIELESRLREAENAMHLLAGEIADLRDTERELRTRLREATS